MNKKNNNKGFTLAELLIVVAIIAVLVAIAIPVFSTQLEKSRDSVSVANIRSAYAQAQTEALTATANTTNGDVKVTMTAAAPAGAGGGADTAARLQKVEVRNVLIKSQKANNWSDQANQLPFYEKLPNDGNHGDAAQNGYVTVTFTYTTSDDLDIASVAFSDMYNTAKTGTDGFDTT